MLDEFSTSRCYCYLFHQLVLPFCENCASLLLHLYWITIPAFNFFFFFIFLLEEWLSAAHVTILKLTFGVEWLGSLSCELIYRGMFKPRCAATYIYYLHFLLPFLYYCVPDSQAKVIVAVHPDLVVAALIYHKTLFLAHRQRELWCLFVSK